MNKDFVVDTGQKFISNVLGGAGAIWGSSEVVCLRNQNNKRLYHYHQLLGAFIIFIYFLKSPLSSSCLSA